MSLLLSRLDEPQRRWYVATLSLEPGSPPDCRLVEVTGLDEKTIRRGRAEMEKGLAMVPEDRKRREGGGRPAAEKRRFAPSRSELEADLNRIIAAHTAGDPIMSFAERDSLMGTGPGANGRWLAPNMRLRRLKERLLECGHRVRLPPSSPWIAWRTGVRPR